MTVLPRHDRWIAKGTLFSDGFLQVQDKQIMIGINLLDEFLFQMLCLLKFYTVRLWEIRLSLKYTVILL